MSNLKNLTVGFLSRHRALAWLLSSYRDWRSGRAVIDHANDAPVGYVQDENGVSSLEPAESAVQAGELPNQLVVQGGFYSFRDVIYDCRNPGVYRFVGPQKINRQHIVLHESDPLVNALLVSFVCLRGNRDSKKLQQQLEAASITRFLSLTCGPACVFAGNILNSRGFRCRVVYSHTLGELNSYNNGHALLEVFSPSLNRYVAVDIDKKCQFRLDGELASLYQYSEALFNARETTIDLFSQAAMVDYLGFTERATGFSYGFVEHAISAEKALLADCLARICQAPVMIDDGDRFACAWDEESARRLQEIDPGWRILDGQSFFDKFYLRQ